MSAAGEGVGPGGAGAGGRWGAAAGGAVIGLAVAGTFLGLAGERSRPDAASVVSLVLTLLVGAALVARVSARAWWVLPAALLALVAAAPGADDVGDLVGAGPAPGLALLLAAAVAAVASAFADRRSPVAAPGRRRYVAAGVVLALAAGTAGGRLALDDAPAAARPSPLGGDALVRAIVDDQDNQGRARATTVVRGAVLEVAGDHVMLALDREPDADGQVRSDGIGVIDARSGALVWRIDGPLAGVVGTADGTGFVVALEDGLVRLDAATGEAVWTRPGDMAGPARVDGGFSVRVGRDRVDVVDAATGLLLRSHEAPCPGAELEDAGYVVMTCASAQDGEAFAHVYAAGSERPTWTGVVRRYAPFGRVGAGAVLVPTIDRGAVVVDVATGVERFAVPLGDVTLLDTGGDEVVTLDVDGVVTRRDGLDGRVTGTVTLAPGPEQDTALLAGDRDAVTVEGGLLVLSHRLGVGTAWSPAGERRRGLVMWDLGTGARVERAVAGPIVAAPDALRLHTLAVVDRVVAIGEDGPRRAGGGRFATIFSVGAP